MQGLTVPGGKAPCIPAPAPTCIVILSLPTMGERENPVGEIRVGDKDCVGDA
jgi:hypothetical protein